MNQELPPADRTAAYTSVRSDLADMVPGEAMSVLDVGCSNGALGANLRAFGRGGTRLNRPPQMVKGAARLRELLTHQFSLRARPPAGRT